MALSSSLNNYPLMPQIMIMNRFSLSHELFKIRIAKSDLYPALHVKLHSFGVAVHTSWSQLKYLFTDLLVRSCCSDALVGFTDQSTMK